MFGFAEIRNVESLEQGAMVADIYANAGALLRPLRSRQYEVGIKSEHERWAATAALFRIERGVAYANSQNCRAGPAGRRGREVHEQHEGAAGRRPADGRLHDRERRSELFDAHRWARRDAARGDRQHHESPLLDVPVHGLHRPGAIRAWSA
ncbi:hypothetical protein OKW34_004662 [Paraburkholderia youngii]